MSGVRALLLDLDGTLVDTAPDMAAALNAVQRGHGVEPTAYGRIRPRVSDGARGLIELAFPDAGDGEAEELREAFLAAYAEQVHVASELFPGMAEVLGVLAAAGLPWGVVTNKPARFTDPLLASMGLDGVAAIVVSGDTAARAKPHPDPLQHAAAALGVPTADCLYVGDAARDVEAARAAGMPVVVALWGYLGVAARPGDWGADALLETPQALVPLLGL